MFRQGTINNVEIHPSSCTTVYDEGDNNIRILSSPTPSQENQNKPSFILSDNLTSTPNQSKYLKEKLSKKLTTLSIKKENNNFNQNNMSQSHNEVVEYVATSQNDKIKSNNDW